MDCSFATVMARNWAEQSPQKRGRNFGQRPLSKRTWSNVTDGARREMETTKHTAATAGRGPQDQGGQGHRRRMRLQTTWTERRQPKTTLEWKMARLLDDKPNPDVIMANIEREMTKSVREQFPHLHERTYFVPPVPFTEVLRLKPSSIPGCLQHNPILQSDIRASEASERFVSSLQEVLEDKNVFAIQRFNFDGYLRKLRPRSCRLCKFPRPQDMPPQYQRGDCDLLLVDKARGILFVEIKAVGATTKDVHCDEGEEKERLSKVLKRVVPSLRKGKEVLLHVLSDIPDLVPVSVLLALPNVTRARLKDVLKAESSLEKELKQCLKKELPVEDMCLCADDLPARQTLATDQHLARIEMWWNRLLSKRQTALPDQTFERIIGRLCGHFSIVSVHAGLVERKEIRTLGQAVKEIGQHFATPVLLPEHKAMLNENWERLVYLTGGPGSGKTTLLALKAVQWIRERYCVCVLTASPELSAASLVMRKKILDAVNNVVEDKPEHDEVITVYSLDADGLKNQAPGLASGIEAWANDRPIFFVMDDIQRWMTSDIHAILSKFPTSYFWTSGASPGSCPKGFAVRNLSKLMRCPPSVQRLLKMTEPLQEEHEPLTSGTRYRYVTLATEDMTYPALTTGPPVTLFSHNGHGGVPVLKCSLCADNLADYLKELRVGKDVAESDVLIVTEEPNVSPEELQFVGALGVHGLRVQTIKEYDGSQTDLAFPSKITLTSVHFVAGLERKVVIFLPGGVPSKNEINDTSSSSSPDRCAPLFTSVCTQERKGTSPLSLKRTKKEDEVDPLHVQHKEPIGEEGIFSERMHVHDDFMELECLYIENFSEDESYELDCLSIADLSDKESSAEDVAILDHFSQDHMWARHFARLLRSSSVFLASHKLYTCWDTTDNTDIFQEFLNTSPFDNQDTPADSFDRMDQFQESKVLTDCYTSNTKPNSDLDVNNGHQDSTVLKSHQSRLEEAVSQLTRESRDRLWHAASRSLSHVVLFHFRN